MLFIIEKQNFLFKEQPKNKKPEFILIPIFATLFHFYLKKQITIQRSIAGFLLCLFALAMTPEKLLHDLFANHVDERNHCTIATTHVHKALPNCHCDKIVVHTPFVESQFLQTAESFAVTAAIHTCYLFTQPKELPQQFCLRGPPSFSISC